MNIYTLFAESPPLPSLQNDYSLHPEKMSHIHKPTHTRAEQLATDIASLKLLLASREWDHLVRTREHIQASKEIEGRVDEQESVLFRHKQKLSKLRTNHESSHPICLRVKAAIARCRLALRELYSVTDEEGRAFKAYQEDFDSETTVLEDDLTTLTLGYFDAGGK